MLIYSKNKVTPKFLKRTFFQEYKCPAIKAKTIIKNPGHPEIRYDKIAAGKEVNCKIRMPSVLVKKPDEIGFRLTFLGSIASSSASSQSLTINA